MKRGKAIQYIYDNFKLKKPFCLQSYIKNILALKGLMLDNSTVDICSIQADD